MYMIIKLDDLLNCMLHLIKQILVHTNLWGQFMEYFE